MVPAIFTRLPCAALVSCTPALVLTLALLAACSGQLMDEAGIVANDYINHGYQAALRSKRVLPVSSTPCSVCASSYSPESCLSCWMSTARDVPVHGVKRQLPPTPASDGFGYPATEVEKRMYSYQRQMRNSGCACCYHSRFNNKHCCRLCQRTNIVKRSPAPAGVGAYDAPAYGPDSDCLCCALGEGLRSLGCCSRCLAK